MQSGSGPRRITRSPRSVTLAGDCGNVPECVDRDGIFLHCNAGSGTGGQPREYKRTCGRAEDLLRSLRHYRIGVLVEEPGLPDRLLLLQTEERSCRSGV